MSSLPAPDPPDIYQQDRSPVFFTLNHIHQQSNNKEHYQSMWKCSHKPYNKKQIPKQMTYYDLPHFLYHS